MEKIEKQPGFEPCALPPQSPVGATPETENEAFYITNGHGRIEVVRADFARRLEASVRELRRTAQQPSESRCADALRAILAADPSHSQLEDWCQWVMQLARDNLRPAQPSKSSRATDVPEQGTYYGQDCPKGKVQIEFVGCDPKERYSNYGWKPVDSAFLEVYVDGQRYRIDVGSFQAGDGSWRRGLHVCGPLNLQVDKHSLNAFDAFHSTGPTKEASNG
jgi:hypothetical protein